MRPRRVAASFMGAVLVAGLVVLVGVGTAEADGSVSVPVTCTGIPILGTTTATVTVNATDDTDPVTVGGTVTNTLNVPIPVGDVPISVTVKEVKITEPIPAGVTVDDVTFTASSFSSQTWAISGSNLVATLTGNVAVGGGAPNPTVPDLNVKTTVAGPARTVQWLVPSLVTAKADAGGIIGTFTASCTPDDNKAVLIDTTVVSPNHAPVAADQTLPVPFETQTPFTISATDLDGDQLTYSTVTSPTHGTLQGSGTSWSYTPASGYSGTDTFVFSASDGSLSDTGTVTFDVSSAPTTVPGSPSITGVSVGEGQATVTWDPPASTGGSPITGYVVTPYVGATAGTPVSLDGSARSATLDGLANGTSVTLHVAAQNGVGTGPDATSAEVTPQWWLPWPSGPVAVTDLFTWMTASPPTATQLSSWLAQLNAGTALPGDLVAALRAGTDATANVDPTVRLYAAYLTRIPDAGGLNFWLRRRRSGYTLSRISSSFADSSEFKRRYGKLTNRQFVEQIYLNVLGRTGESSGVDYWTRQLDSRRKSRGQVMINFSESHEYITKQVNNVHAAAVFIHVLGTTPTVGERDGFVAELVGGTSIAAAVRELIHDPSFAARAG